MKEGGAIILAVVLLLPCPADAVFRCENATTLFGLPKEDTTRNQWLSCIYNTVPEQYKTNIGVCAAHSVLKDCFYKVEQFQLWQASDSQPVSMF